MSWGRRARGRDLFPTESFASKKKILFAFRQEHHSISQMMKDNSARAGEHIGINIEPLHQLLLLSSSVEKPKRNPTRFAAPSSKCQRQAQLCMCCRAHFSV
eukprot:m.74891 g.74891  ORF g.74891 m.74891 type:complete len:101 (+) comp8068_c0_seq2:12399-12701(+)